MNEEEIMNIINKLFTIEEVLIQDDKDGHSSAYEMQFEDFEAIHGLLDIIEKQQKEIERKNKVFDDCKYTIIEYVKTAKDTMQKMEAMIEIEKDVINGFDKLLKGE